MDDRVVSGDGGDKIPNSFHHHHGGHRRHHHHHHHFFYISPQCPLHRPILQPKNHSPSCNFSTSYPAASAQPDPNSGFPVSQPGEELDGTSMMIQDEAEIEIGEADGEEEPVFVLTDEWREFFAKSEAKRTLAKKQAKKGKN